MSSAPVRRQLSRIASAIRCDIGRTPPSPWIGSTMTAAVSLVTAACSAAGSSGRHERHVADAAARTARGSGRPRSPTARPSSGRGTSARTRRTCRAACPARASSGARTSGTLRPPPRRCCRRTRDRRPDSARQPRRDLRLQRMKEQVRRVEQLGRLRRRSRRPASDARGRATRRRRRRSGRGSCGLRRCRAGSPRPARTPPGCAGRPAGCVFASAAITSVVRSCSCISVPRQARHRGNESRARSHC